MKLPRSGPGKLSLEVIELADQERPPMIRIPEYAERRAEEQSTNEEAQAAPPREDRPAAAAGRLRR
jgi:hypothetical protein